MGCLRFEDPYLSVYRFFCVLFLLFAFSFAQEPPHSLVQPRDVNCIVGDTASFSVSAQGSRPLTYQWYRDTVVLEGKNDSVLNVGPVQYSESGSRYRCAVRNADGTAYSNDAQLIVRRPSSQLIVVSGELFEKDGSLIGEKSPVVMDLTVKLYPTLSSDSAVYIEEFRENAGKGVDITRSQFFVRLGDGITENNLQQTVQSFSNLFVEFSVTRPGGVPETLVPRTPLTSSPYALSGASEILKGEVDPNAAGIVAPVGTHYRNNDTGKNYIRTYNKWVELVQN